MSDMPNIPGQSGPSEKARPFFLIAILIVVAVSSFYIGYKTSPQLQQAAASALSVDSNELLVTSPNAEDYFVSLISSANQSIDVEMYVFSDKRLAEGLIAAKNRGVKVRVILERRIEGDTSDDVIALLNAADVDLRYASTSFKLTHSKFAIVDGKISVVGSHNWTAAAMTKNRETSVQTDDPAFVLQLSGMFEQDWLIATAA